MIIIKYVEKLATSDRANMVYEQVTDPNKKGSRINRTKAMQLINELGLVLVVNNQYGKIWDTPNKDFYSKFHNV